jgi:hypothetical protein
MIKLQRIGDVVEVEHPSPGRPSRYRPTGAGRSNTDLKGDPLTVRSLSSALTSTANYRMTICAVKQASYCSLAFEATSILSVPRRKP